MKYEIEGDILEEAIIEAADSSANITEVYYKKEIRHIRAIATLVGLGTGILVGYWGPKLIDLNTAWKTAAQTSLLKGEGTPTKAIRNENSICLMENGKVKCFNFQ